MKANLRVDSLRATVQILACVSIQVVGAAAAGASESDLKRGEYLARAADCVSCHTSEGGQAYAGGLAMGTPFGTIYTPNITPDEETGIGSWTGEEFFHAMHDGVGKHAEYLYPVMPFTFYTKMPRKDVQAIYAYLKSLEPVRKRNRGVHFEFPFNVRLSMLAWRELYFRPGTFVPIAGRSKQWNRGAYLVQGPGHCGACHSPRNVMGGIEKDRRLTGAEVDHWFALNLTSDLHSGLGGWTQDELVAFLKTGSSRRKGTALGPMAEVVHNSLAYLSDEDLRAMAVYLKSVPAMTTSAAAVSGAYGLEGSKLYLSNCARCHQAGGTGIAGVFPSLKGNGVVNAEDPADMLKVVLQGIPARGKLGPMPRFADRLTNRQLSDLLNYVRASWGNSAPANVTPDLVATWRGYAGVSRTGTEAAQKLECPSFKGVPASLLTSMNNSVKAASDELLRGDLSATRDIVAGARNDDPKAGTVELISAAVIAFCPLLEADTRLSNAAKHTLWSRFATSVAEVSLAH